MSVGSSVLYFFQLSVGGSLFGILIGLAVSFWLGHVFNDMVIEIMLTLVSAYLTFWIAESSALGFHLSGILAVVFLGFTLCAFKNIITPEVERHANHFWNIVSFFANTLIFILSGDIVSEKIFDVSGITFHDFGLSILLFISLTFIRLLSVRLTW